MFNLLCLLQYWLLFLKSFFKFLFDLKCFLKILLLLFRHYFCQFTTVFLLNSSSTFFFFWLCHTACGILVPQPGIKPPPLNWKHGVLTTGPPGKSQVFNFYINFFLTFNSFVSSVISFLNFPKCCLLIYFSLSWNNRLLLICRLISLACFDHLLGCLFCLFCSFSYSHFVWNLTSFLVHCSFLSGISSP